MTESVTSEDALSTESTKMVPISTDADIPTQVSEIIDRIEKQQGSINHIRKTVRLLRDRVTMPDGLPQGTTNPLSAKEQNEALSRYVDRTTFKNQMKQIAIKIDEIIRSQKGHSQQELEEKIEDAFKQINQEKERNDHIMSTANQRIDVLTEKLEKNVSDSAKAIGQLKKGHDDLKNNFKTVIKSAVDLSRNETGSVKNSLEEFKKTQLENFKKVNTTILKLKEEIGELKKRGSIPAGEGTDEASAAAPAAASSVDLSSIISRLETLEFNINSKTEELSLKIEEIAQDVKNGEKATEDLSSKMNDFDNQYSLDCEQRREHDTEIDTELSKVKLSIEAAETEIKNQTEKVTRDFDDKLTKQKSQITESTNSKIESHNEEFTQKLDDQKQQLESLIKEDLNQQIQEMKKQMESTNVDQLKSEINEKFDEQKKQIESLSNNAPNIDQIKAEINQQLENQKKQIDSLSNDTSKVDSLKAEISQQLEELKNQINSSNSNAASIDSLRSEVSEEIDKLKKSLEQLINEKSEQQNSQIATIINNTTNIENLKNEINQKIEQQNNQINTITTNMTNFNAYKSDLEAKLEKQQQQINESSINEEKVDKKLDDLKNQLATLIDEKSINNCKSLQSSLEAKINEVKSLADTLLQDKQKLEMLNKIITGQINDIRTEIKTKDTEYNQKFELVTAQLNNGHTDKKDISSDAVMMLQDQISALRSEQAKHNKAADDTINKINLVVAQKVDFNQSEQIHGLFIQQMHQMKEDFNKEIEDIKNKMSTSQKQIDPEEFEQLKSNVDRIKQIEQKHGEFETKIQNTKADCEGQVQQLKTIYDSSVAEIKEIYQQSITELKNKAVKQVEERMDNIQEEMNKIKEKLDNQSQPQVIERAINLPQEENPEIQEIQKQIEELKNLQKQNSEKSEAAINDLSGNFENLKSSVYQRFNDSKNATDDLVSKNQSNIDTINSLKETISTFESRVEQINQLNEKVIQLEKETSTIQTLTETINTINSKVEQVTQLNEKVSQFEKEINTIQALTETINTINSKVEQVTQLNEKVSQFEKEISTIQTLTETINTINSKVEQVTQLNEKVIQLEKETNTIQTLTETINTINSKVEQVTQLNEKVEQLEKETSTIQSLTDNINTINSKVEQVAYLNDKVAEIEKETANIQSLTENVNNQLKDKLSAIETNIKDVQTREINLESHPVDSSELTELKENLAKLKEKVDSMTKTEEQLTNQLADFKEEYDKNVNSTAEIISETVTSFKTAHDGTASEIQEIKDKVGEVVNKLSEKTLERLQKLEDNFSSVSENSAKCTAELDELKGKMYTTFVTADALDTIKQKRKNLKENVKTMVTELNSYIETERNERTKSIEEINSLINGINQSMKESSEKAELESKYNKEQIKKILKQVNRMSKSNNIGDNGNEGQSQSASPELIMDVDELKFKLKQMEELNSKYKDDINEINKTLQEFTTKMNEQKDDYSNRISNLEFVSNSEQKDIMDKILKLEDQFDSTKKSMADLPGMVMEANQMNQASINEFSQHVEDTLTDMKSQLKQATFADDDITELTKKFSQFEESFNKSNTTFSERISKVESEINKRRQAETEFSKIWSAINDNKVKIDVQLEKTNPQISNMISNLKKTQKEIKEIVMKQNGVDEIEPESEETTSSTPPPEYAAQIEMIKAKVQMLEEENRKYGDAITHIQEDISINKDSIDRATKQIREEMVEMRNKLPESFIEIDSFNGLKEEVNVIHGALNTAIETSVSEREKLEEQVNNFSESLGSIQSNVKNEAQTLLQHALKNSNISAKDINLSDAEIKSDDDENSSKMPTAVIGAEDSSTNVVNGNEVSDLKLMINGIDIALQRQIRKLKISVRNIERMLEDAAEEEKRQQEIEKQKKEKEELAKEIIEEEEMKRKLEEEDKVEEEEEVVDDNEVVKLNKSASQKDVQIVQQQPGAVVYVEADNNNDNDNSNSTTHHAIITTVKLPTAVELIQDDFNIFFVLMFSVLLYFLVSDLFLS